MKITIYCENCSENVDEPNMEMVIMKEEGPLVFNQDTKSQCQEYKCEKCLRRISLLIEIK